MMTSTFLFRFMSSILALSSFILFIVIEFSRLCCAAAQFSPSSSSVHILYRELPLKKMQELLLVLSQSCLLNCSLFFSIHHQMGEKLWCDCILRYIKKQYWHSSHLIDSDRGVRVPSPLSTTLKKFNWSPSR